MSSRVIYNLLYTMETDYNCLTVDFLRNQIVLRIERALLENW